jgi:hypothetical protein
MDLEIPHFPNSKIESLPESARLLWSLWDKARSENNGLIPPRSMIKAMKLGSHAANCFVLQREQPGHFTFKMCGTGFDKLFGRNLTGCDLRVIAHADSAHLLIAFCEAVITKPCAAFARDITTSPAGERIMSEGLTLPLANQEGKVNQVFCCSNITRHGFSGGDKPDQVDPNYRELKAAYFIDLEDNQ